MKVSTKLNYGEIARINQTIELALIETADATLADLQDSQTMPFDTGALQNRGTNRDTSNISKGVVSIVSDTPYARRLYYHPEYNFRTDKNPHAGGMWFQPYIDGNKKAFCQNAFKRLLGSTLKWEFH